MALSRIRSINGLSDPLRQYQCKFHISKGLGTLATDLTSKARNGKTTMVRKEDFELRALSWTYPGTVVKTVDTVVFNHYRRRPALQDKSGTWKVTVVEDMEGNVIQSIQDWCDIIMNPATGAYGLSEDYVGQAAVEICGADMKANKTIYLKGFYPIRISEMKIDTSSSQTVNVDLEFNYDWYTETGWTYKAVN